MKTAEELNALKAEVELLKKKLAGLTDEELEQVNGGCGAGIRFAYLYCSNPECPNHNAHFLAYPEPRCKLCGAEMIWGD